MSTKARPVNVMSAKMKFAKIAFLASDAPEAKKALTRLSRRYGNAGPAQADVVVVTAICCKPCTVSFPPVRPSTA